MRGYHLRQENQPEMRTSCLRRSLSPSRRMLPFSAWTQVLDLGRQALPSPRALVPVGPSNVLYLFHILVYLSHFVHILSTGYPCIGYPYTVPFSYIYPTFLSSSPQSFGLSNTEVSLYFASLLRLTYCT